jgi:DNA-binding MarR family transcriptional regulator
VTKHTYSSDPLLFFIIRLGRLVTNKMSQKLGEEEQRFMGPHMGILHDLVIKDGTRQQDLAISSLKDKATIARSLRLLEKEGMVLRSPDPTDRRTKRIFITPKGKRFFQRVFPSAQEIMEEAKSGISPDDLSASIKVLQKMYDNLNK